MRLRIGLSLLVVLVCGLAVAWFLHTHERVPDTLELPPRGEAVYNPLYALRGALRADGVAAESRARLRLATVPLAPQDTVLLYSDPRVLLPSEVDGLLAWVAAGGHLLVRTPLPRGEEVQQAELLERLEIQVGDVHRCESMRVHGYSSHDEFCAGNRFYPATDALRLAWGDVQGDGLVYARLAHGRGTVDVLADFDFLDNDALDEAPHALLVRQLLAPGWGQGTVHLVYATQVPSLWRQILLHGWMAWGPLLLALLAWLWARGQRLGPLLPSPLPARRELLEHVRASGEHMVRYGRSAQLYQAVRDAFLERLRRRDPLAAALEGDAGIEAIAVRTGLSASEVGQALQPPSADDAAGLRQRIARLIQMRNLL